MAVNYVVSQLLGATTAAGACRVIFPADSVAVQHLGLPLPAAWASTGVVLLAEFIMTFLLMSAIFGTAVDERGRGVKIGGFGVGLTVAFDILAGGAVTGASMNPARSFGPALELMYWQWHWVYWVAPIAGACCAALIYENLLLERVVASVDEPRVKQRWTRARRARSGDPSDPRTHEVGVARLTAGRRFVTHLAVLAP